MSRKKLLPRLEVAEKFFLTSSPRIDVRIRDFPVSTWVAGECSLQVAVIHQRWSSRPAKSHDYWSHAAWFWGLSRKLSVKRQPWTLAYGRATVLFFTPM